MRETCFHFIKSLCDSGVLCPTATQRLSECRNKQTSNIVDYSDLVLKYPTVSGVDPSKAERKGQFIPCVAQVGALTCVRDSSHPPVRVNPEHTPSFPPKSDRISTPQLNSTLSGSIWRVTYILTVSH